MDSRRLLRAQPVFLQSGDRLWRLGAHTDTDSGTRADDDDANNYHISLWYRDELDDGKPEAHGIAFNANQKVGENAMWLGFALGWANPSNDLLDDQYTTEAFYRFHVTPALVHGSEIFRTRVFEAAVYAVVDMRRTDFGRAPKPVPGIPRDTHIDL